jgi:hypothetical protein
LRKMAGGAVTAFGTERLQSDNKMKGILFSEFDPIAGPKLAHQVPSGLLEKESFEAISDYIITKPQLCGKIISLKAFGLQVMGYPVCMEHNKFARNALWFNLCFVFSPEVDTSAHAPVLRKLANALIVLETESEFLSRVATSERLLRLLSQLFYDLNTHGQTSIPIDDANTIHLRLSPKLSSPPQVRPYDVPVRIVDLDELLSKEWDLTLQHVIPYIDGVRYVKRIAKESGVHLDLVIAAMHHLLYYKCITMVDIFQYSNVYVCTPRIRLLAQNRHMQQECARAVFLPGKETDWEKLFALYTALRPGLTFREFCQEHDLLVDAIDHRSFITFGVINGFVRRVYKYPLYCPSNPLASSSNIRSRLPSQLKVLLDGRQHFDAICCELERSNEEVAQFLDVEQSYVAVLK